MKIVRDKRLEGGHGQRGWRGRHGCCKTRGTREGGGGGKGSPTHARSRSRAGKSRGGGGGERGERASRGKEWKRLRKRSEVSRTLDEADATPTERHPREKPSLHGAFVFFTFFLLRRVPFLSSAPPDSPPPLSSLASREDHGSFFFFSNRTVRYTYTDTEFLAYQRACFGTFCRSRQIIARPARETAPCPGRKSGRRSFD
ncbi:hypothetical protein PUN28_005364 [Cardiocondyla obscurior]|uniref:Uncharacterized protein n=1 Tax=Cardiocondyla obscurior TaxID=286306 RepID=A0AAW2GHE8_9HYME